MKEFIKLNILEVPLKGMNLVEASAGTGKTYSIALLVLRMIIEKKMKLGEMLIVTFTNAATAELKGRIRNFILQATRACEGSSRESDEKTIGDMVTGNGHDKTLTYRLKEAVRTLDEAPVYTIHGFCQRSLMDHSFATGSPFDSELIEDQSAVIEQIVSDKYRRDIGFKSPEFIALMKKGGVTVEELCSLINDVLKKPFLQVDAPGKSNPDELWEDIRKEWREKSDVIKESFITNKALKRNMDVFKQPWLDELFKRIDEGVANDAMCVDELFKLRRSYVNKQVTETAKKKGIQPPDHNLLDLCENLFETAAVVKKETVDYVHKNLRRRKEILGVMSFDDLLSDMHAAVTENEGKDYLKSILRKRYKAAFIDEFQDTDRMQCAIFTEIFDHDDSVLFMIGDPKQSIYRFRGADITSYLKIAARKNLNKYTLTTNYRSSERVIKSVNRIFGRENPFRSEEIQYHEIEAPKADCDKGVFTIDGRDDVPAMVIIKDDTSTSKSNAEPKILKTVPAEIAQLLINKKVRIQGRDCRPGDVAILVRKKKFMPPLKAALNKYGIPAVINAGESVFHSETAEELQMILSSMLEPTNAGYIRASLLTAMLGYSTKQIEEMMQSENDTLWEGIAEKFRKYSEQWHDRNVTDALGLMIHDFQVTAALLSHEDGERRMTNLRHLIELMKVEETQHSLCPQELLAWFNRNVAGSGQEDHELRLESDADAVQILTVHKSKGLEFPIVFFPYALDAPGLSSKGRPYAIYTDEDGPRMVLRESELGEAFKLADEEDFQENLRLFYVAVTRAKYLCYTYYGPNIGKPKGGPQIPSFHFLKIIVDEAAKHTDCIRVTAVEEIENAAEGLSLKYENRDDKKSIKPRVFTGTVGKSNYLSSFTDLVRETSAAGQEFNTEPKGIHKFPRGAHVGTALHEIFERIDFAHDENHDTMIRTILTKHNLIGKKNEWHVPVMNMTAHILSSHLSDAVQAFKLGDIPKSDKITELEFYMNAASIQRKELISILGEKAGDISHNDLHGYIKGFIDCVFRVNGRYYILDWKSNWIGPDSSYYSEINLNKAMEQHNYHLQYYIYSAALHEFLKQQLAGYGYENDFGGVFYIFMRGFDAERDMTTGNDCDRAGIFFKKPELEKLEKMSDMFQIEAAS